jgi:hypothetical protein
MTTAKKACRWNTGRLFSSTRSGVVRLMIFQRYRPAAEDHHQTSATSAGIAPT